MPFGPLATAGGGGGGGAPDDAQYVVMVANATLTQERVLTGTASRIVVTDGGAGGAVTLSPGALIVQTDQANTWTVGSQIIQTAVDTTTAFQVFDADGGAPVLSVDTINERVGIGTAAPAFPFYVYGDVNSGYQIVCRNDSDGVSAYASQAVINDDGWFAELEMTSSNNTGFGGSNRALFNSNAPNGLYFRMQSASSITFGVGNVARMTIGPTGNVLVNGFTTATVGLTIKAAAAQTAAMLQLQDSTGGVVVDSGHGLTGSEFVFNQGGIDIDFRVESLTYDAINVDAATDGLKLMDNAAGKIGFFGQAPRVQIDKASFNNWAAFTDVVDALVDLGLFDAA